MAGKHGLGAEFHLHDGANPGVLVKAANVDAVTPPSPTVETIDTTTHDSPGGYREFIAGLIDAGEGSIRLNWIAGDETDLLFTAARDSKELRAWKINVPAGTGTVDFTGNGLVTNWAKDEVVVDGKMSGVLTMKASGPITEGPGA